MILKRLTKSQKHEILEGYRTGHSTNDLAIQFDCSPNTVNRTVKTLISEDEYKILKDKRSKINKAKMGSITYEITNKELENPVKDLIQERSMITDKTSKDDKDSFTSLDDKSEMNSFEKDLSEISSLDKKLRETNSKSHKYENQFEEIAPLESSFCFDVEKRKQDLYELDNKILPEIAYMIVDKKVELDAQLISSLPDWSFLPKDELERQAILLFATQRSAKRSCSRNQRVIKIPNTKVFQTTKSFLVSKGITRLIIDDSLISLIN